MNGRELLSNELKAALPTWQIINDARAIDQVRNPGAVVLWTSRRLRPQMQQLNTLQDEITVWVLSPAEPIRLEDDLDDKLQAVLEVIENQPALYWEEANREVLDDKFPGWRITVQCAYKLGE